MLGNLAEALLTLVMVDRPRTPSARCPVGAIARKVAPPREERAR